MMPGKRVSSCTASTRNRKALPRPIVFARDRFVREHHADRAAEVDKNISALEALDHAAHDLPFASAPLVQNRIALGLAQAFAKSPASPSAPQCGRNPRVFQAGTSSLSQLNIFFYLLRFIKRDVSLRIEAWKFLLIILFDFLFFFLAPSFFSTAALSAS
jgi:hypothetical protein